MVRREVADAPEDGSHRARLALLAAAALVFVLWRLPFVSVPLERDEGEYAYIAQRILAGDVPYRDAFDQKPPAIFAAYLAAFALFGPSVVGIHLFLYLWTAATAVALDDLVRRCAGGLAAGFAVLVFAAVSVEPRLAATAANTELFMLLPLVASTSLLWRALASDRAATWLACGACAALACWFKPVAAVNGLFLGGFAAGDLWLRGRAARLPRAAALLGAGAAAVSLPVFAGFAALGAWEPFTDAVFLHNLAYAARVPLAAGVHYAASALAHQAPSLLGLWGLAAVGLILPGALSRRTRIFLGGFALASVLGTAAGFYFRPHYFVQTLAALAALAGAGATALLRPLLGRPRLAWTGVGALAAALLLPPLWTNRALLGAPPERISREIYGLNPFVESAKVADYIRRTSEPDESVYVVGSEPQILFHAERRSATRYIFFYPLTSPFPDALERQQAAMREVQAARPRYVVWVHLPDSMLFFENSEDWIFEATSELLDRSYHLEFLAVPPGPDADPLGPFEFVYGSRARRLLGEALAEEQPTPWMAVFRRAS